MTTQPITPDCPPHGIERPTVEAPDRNPAHKAATQRAEAAQHEQDAADSNLGYQPTTTLTGRRPGMQRPMTVRTFERKVRELHSTEMAAHGYQVMIDTAKQYGLGYEVERMSGTLIEMNADADCLRELLIDFGYQPTTLKAAR